MIDWCRTAIYYQLHPFRLCMATGARVFIQCFCMNRLPKCDSSRRRRNVVLWAETSPLANRTRCRRRVSQVNRWLPMHLQELHNAPVYDNDALLAVAGLLLVCCCPDYSRREHYAIGLSVHSLDVARRESLLGIASTAVRHNYRSSDAWRHGKTPLITCC